MITAKIILDSTGICGTRLTTMELHYPRFILAEVNTHRVFSRNTASSRAIPTAKLIEQVRDNPFVPKAFTVNRPGMSSDQVLTGEEHELARAQWIAAARDAVIRAQQLLNIGVHKQHVNRLIEPFMWVTQIVSSTEWGNFFKLRCHAAAQPEIRELAEAMRAALQASEPKALDLGVWHLPYLDGADHSMHLEDQKLISAARCARVSYLNHDADRPASKDLALARRLIDDRHLSPFEHIATPSHSGYANFYGWKQFRKDIE